MCARISPQLVLYKSNQIPGLEQEAGSDRFRYGFVCEISIPQKTMKPLLVHPSRDGAGLGPPGPLCIRCPQEALLLVVR